MQKLSHKWEPLPEKIRVGIFRFPFDMKEMSTTVDWLVSILSLPEQPPAHRNGSH